MLALAALLQLQIVAHAPDTVRACDAIEVSVAVSGVGSDIPRILAPSFRPFDVLRAGTPRVSYERGRSTVTVEQQFVITTDRTGRFTIPPFEARAKSGTVSAAPTVFTVLPMMLRGPSVVARARIDTGVEMSMSAAAAETIYVGQQATYEVAVFLNQVTRDRLRRNPTFYPPEMQSLLAYDLPSASQGFRQRSGSQCFDALVYRRAVFPLQPGKVVIPPAQLVYSTALSTTSMFSREESHELQTDSVSIIALDAPRDGRPAEFSGAVGAVRLEARFDNGTARVGDPMLYTVRVLGSGNVKLFPRPTVRIPWAGLVAADERVSVDSAASKVGGVKEFDWVLTPRIAGEFDVPPVRYGYFDPSRRRYDVAVSNSNRISVAAGALAAGDTGQADGPLPIRTRYVGPAGTSPQSSPLFWIVLAIAPIPALITMRRRPSLPPAGRAPRRDSLQMLNAVATSDDPVALRRLYVSALAQRLGASPSDFTNAGALEKALRRAGVSESTAARAEEQLRELDKAAYAGGGTLPANAAKNANQLAKAVDQEALARHELPFWVPIVVMAAILGTASVADSREPGAESQERGAATSFAAGVSSYLRQDFIAARDAFADAVTRDPRSADAWANFGTAAWTSGDTASAILGWRQSLALEPGAADMQARIGSLHPVGASSPGFVPAMPTHLVVWLGAALWIVAWAIAWFGRTSAGTFVRWTLPLAAAASVCGMVAVKVDEAVAGKDVAVVRRALSLSVDPAIGLDRGPGVGVGEMLRVTNRKGSWVHVEAGDGRAGWLSDEHIALLADRRIPR